MIFEIQMLQGSKFTKSHATFSVQTSMISAIIKESV